MINIYKTKFLLVGLFFCALGLAQTSSPYSRYGLGDFQSRGSIRTRTMGSAATAIQERNDINTLNPSSLVAMDSMAVLFDIGFHANISNYSSGSQSENIYSGNLDYVAMMIPMHKRWFFAATVQPLTTVGYNINTIKSKNDMLYNANYQGNGGVTLATLINSFKLPFGLSLGVETGILWGNHNETITESHPNLDITSTVRNTTDYHTGYWLTTGAQWAQSLKDWEIVLGATYDVPTQITSDAEAK